MPTTYAAPHMIPLGAFVTRTYKTPLFATFDDTVEPPIGNSCPIVPAPKVLYDDTTKSFFLHTPVTIPVNWTFQLWGKNTESADEVLFIDPVVAGQIISIDSLGIIPETGDAYEFYYLPVHIE